jgi:hypothetical protein
MTPSCDRLATGDDGGAILSELLAANRTLTVSSGVLATAGGSGSGAFQALDVSGTRLGSTGTAAVVSAVKGGNVLRALNLSSSYVEKNALGTKGSQVRSVWPDGHRVEGRGR